MQPAHCKILYLRGKKQQDSFWMRILSDRSRFRFFYDVFHLYRNDFKAARKSKKKKINATHFYRHRFWSNQACMHRSALSFYLSRVPIAIQRIMKNKDKMRLPQNIAHISTGSGNLTFTGVWPRGSASSEPKKHDEYNKRPFFESLFVAIYHTEDKKSYSCVKNIGTDGRTADLIT